MYIRSRAWQKESSEPYRVLPLHRHNAVLILLLERATRTIYHHTLM